MSEHAADLVPLLQLERIEDNLFRGESRDIGTRFVFGGQVLGQALSAAQQTVADDRAAHSLHAYFLRAGDIKAPIIYNVERTRDGGSFSMRRVTAIQHGQTIFNAAASFQTPEKGFEHQATMPDVPAPEDIAPPSPLSAQQFEKLPAMLQRWLGRSGPFEFRPVDPRNELDPVKRPPFNLVWFRCVEKAPDSDVMHRAMLAYASDFHLVVTSSFPHGFSFLQSNVQIASLDHALWFHRPFRVDEWLLYSCDSPTAQAGRGLARGQFFDRAGNLVASTAQEGLIRLKDN